MLPRVRHLSSHAHHVGHWLQPLLRLQWKQESVALDTQNSQCYSPLMISSNKSISFLSQILLCRNEDFYCLIPKHPGVSYIYATFIGPRELRVE